MTYAKHRSDIGGTEDAQQPQPAAGLSDVAAEPAAALDGVSVPNEAGVIGHPAAGQFFGFSVQQTRVLAHLLRAREGQAVWLERLDDVATVGNGELIVEQDKSGLAHNPISDRSVELWKTLRSWLDALRLGTAGPGTQFVLYVAQNHSGDVAERIEATQDQAAGEELARALKQEFLPEAPESGDESVSHLHVVLSASDELLGRLFVAVAFERGSGFPNEDLLDAIGEKTISVGARENVCQFLLGWVKSEIDKRIAGGKPPVLTCSEFNRQLLAAAKKFDRSENALFATPVEIDSTQVLRELEERVYVRQLAAIDCERKDLETAVIDYLRAVADRTHWSEAGDVLEVSFEEFQSDLERAWLNHRSAVRVEGKGVSEVDQGQLLRSRCMLSVVPLQGMQVPGHFVPGSLHRLADSVRIGWHPRWEAMFGSQSKRGSFPSPGQEGGDVES